ncbi:YqgE/AlgH family protein [Candidatus Poriferisocius sp.]|uniref:YqgE/AlgH family protein n=1 Tax=Candidatus Poriferisocius sp. TaxID=3101276 RepID=UPI003B023523
MADGADTTGKLLVATPLIGDGNFDRTVVLMLTHQQEGAAGVVLNRPSGMMVSDALPQWAPYLAPPTTMFIGGPVANESVVALARVRQNPLQGWWTALVGLVGTLDLETEIEEVAEAGVVDGIRLFAGYAGWSPGQLEGEIESGAWFVVDADPADLLTTQPGELWPAVLQRQPSPISWFTHYPTHPSHN